MNLTDRSIAGVAKTVSEVLANKKYAIDYYQREYKWTTKQVAELVTDLTSKFLQIHVPGQARKAVSKYPGYFLGSIIISQKGNNPFVVDGQQRMTTLTLFLTYLKRLQEGRAQTVKIDDLIYSESYGEISFNLDIPDRNICMEALFDRGEYDPPAEAVDSVHNLVHRYSELDTIFPEELKGDALPYFIDWLKDRVQLVQITAYNDDDAYAIFETMNDRGLKLTPADMLKGYLLANMEDGDPRNSANELWRQRLRALSDHAEDATSDFLKTWLRSKYSTKIRERRKGAQPEDWDRIGTEFHRWLRGASHRIGLRSPEDFHRFVMHDLDFYSKQYERIVIAASDFHPDSPLRFIRFNADQGFTLQNQLLLAPLRAEDQACEIEAKLEIVGRFVDILLAWRIWNFRSTAYSTMQYAMFNVMREIRDLPAAELATHLYNHLLKVDETFDSNNDLYVHQQNRGQLHKVLARLTDYITTSSGEASNYVELTNGAKVRYEVEHVWANRPERHADEFTHEADFIRHRNRIGGLLLLPKQFNASYSDCEYGEKCQHYYKQNLLAASLHTLSYTKNPGFLSFRSSSGLPFKAYRTFKAADIDERGLLYREVAKKVWDPERLLLVAKQ